MESRKTHDVKKPNYKNFQEMVKNCIWLKDVGCQFVLQCTKQKMTTYPQGPSWNLHLQGNQ
jgi:hypothetical protein